MMKEWMVVVIVGRCFCAEPRDSPEDQWVVAVGTSRYWANYRHTANALAVCDVARRMGVPESKTVAMVAEPCACSGRNPHRGEISLNGRRDVSNVRVTYAGEQVTPRRVLDVLAGRAPGVRSGHGSNVVVYLTGHGGDEFLKFHDAEEISAYELATTLREMRLKRRYRRLLLVVDTCQAGSLFKYLDADSGVLGIASSLIGQNAYATTPDPDVGVALADRFTYSLVKYFNDHMLVRASNCAASKRCRLHNTLGAFVDELQRAPTRSTVQVWDASWSGKTDWRRVPLTDFFGPPPDGNTTVSGWRVDPTSRFDADDIAAVFGHRANNSSSLPSTAGGENSSASFGWHSLSSSVSSSPA